MIVLLAVVLLAAPPSDAYLRGIAALEDGKWEIAVTELESARAAQPAAPDVLLALGAAHAEAGYWVPAIVHLRAHLELRPAGFRGKLTVEQVKDAIARNEEALASAVDAAFEVASISRDLAGDSAVSVAVEMAAAGRTAAVRDFAASVNRPVAAFIAEGAYAAAKNGSPDHSLALFRLAESLAETEPAWLTLPTTSVAAMPALARSGEAAEMARLKSERDAAARAALMDRDALRRRVSQGVVLARIACLENEAGLGARANTTLERARVLVEGWDERPFSFALDENRCRTSLNGESLTFFEAGGWTGKDAPAPKPPAHRWRDVSAGKGPLDLGDPLFGPLKPQVDSLRKLPPEESAVKIAILARRLAETHRFLTRNAPPKR